jgi:hypothetical protein
VSRRAQERRSLSGVLVLCARRGPWTLCVWAHIEGPGRSQRASSSEQQNIPGAGIGVFALHDIASGVWLEVIPRGYQARKFKRHELPDELRSYCVAKGNDIYTCPRQFNRMEIGWYMNHSHELHCRALAG